MQQADRTNIISQFTESESMYVRTELARTIHTESKLGLESGVSHDQCKKKNK